MGKDHPKKAAKKKPKAATPGKRALAKAANTALANRAKKKKKPKSGTPFEKRVRDALQYVHPHLRAEHNLELPMRYREHPRQFDVGLYADEAIAKLFEAKDYGGRVAFNQVEAFETKLRELAAPPTQGGGLVSARGFQKGPLVRARELGDEALARELYQLRRVAAEDWEHRIKAMQFSILCQSLSAENVVIETPDAVDAAAGPTITDRQASFIYSEDGAITLNLLDDINARLRRVKWDATSSTPADLQEICIDLPPGSYLHREAGRIHVTRVKFTPSPTKLKTSIEADLASAAKDTLIDCVGGRKWIIPDPQKTLTAAKRGYDVKLTFEEDASMDPDAVALAPAAGDLSLRRNLELSGAIQLQILLRALRAGLQEAAPPGLAEKLTRASELLQADYHDDAARLYWETCGEATSLDALANLTFIYEQRRDRRQALRLAHRTVELFPLEVKGWENLGKLLLASGELARAAEVFEDARLLHAGHPMLVELEAELHMRGERWPEAARLLAHLCGLNPGNAAARLSLATCELELGNRAAAEWDALQAIRLELPDLKAVHHAVICLSRLDRFEQAARVAETYCARHGTAIAGTGAMRLDAASAACTAELYDVAKTLVHGLVLTDPRLSYVRGLVDVSREEYANAYGHFREYARARPDDAAGWNNMTITAGRAGMRPEAHAAVRAPAFERTDTKEYWSLRILAASEARDVDDALRAAKECERHGVDVAPLLVAESDKALREGDLQRAAGLQGGALLFETKDGTALLNRAFVRIDAILRGREPPGDVRDALDRAERAGAASAGVLHARALVAIANEDVAELDGLESRLLAGELNPNQVVHLAGEAEAHRRSGFVWRLLKALNPKPLPLPGADASPIPWQRSSALS